MKAVFEISEEERKALEKIANWDVDCSDGRHELCKTCPFSEHGCTFSEMAQFALDYSNLPTLKSETKLKKQMQVTHLRPSEIYKFVSKNNIEIKFVTQGSNDWYTIFYEEINE